MATGIPFPEANTVLRAPTPEDAAAGTVYDLHVHRYNDLDGNPNVISKWQFTPDELAQVVTADGEFWFHCWGHTHPPVGIEGANPFVRASRPAEAAERLPANAYAIARSIEVVDRFMEDDDSHILTPEVGESILLVMHELKRLRGMMSDLLADKARLDYLDRCNAALNATYGTTYSWKMIQSHNVTRLMIGGFDVDLNDSQPHGLPSCRAAIDERMREAMERAA